MRLKIFTADNMMAALGKVRDALGEDAIIIDSVEEDGRVRVTAAMELPVPRTAPQKAPRKAPKPKPKQSPVQKSLRDLDREDQAENYNLSYFLAHHGIEKSMMRRILETAAAFEEDKNLTALARALDVMFHFKAVNNDYHDRPIMLVGPPGVGKTVTTAKLASQAILDGRTVRLINTDTIRTGGTAQLEGYAEVLKTTVIEAPDPELLTAAIETHRQADELVIIDTMGYNPFDAAEMAQLHSFICAYDVEPLLVISAGTDPVEAQEISETYANLGVRRFIATRLDVARRYASLLTTANAMDLAFAGVGITPFLANGIEKVDAMSLAQLITHINDRKIFVPPENLIEENMTEEDPDTPPLKIDDTESEKP
ncbi:ATP-binding protein [Paremcibacter congregatus]|uniref:GTPase n=1 Tax=Paremcibacter congregatus TaxID=2043170 RepID=A0A2G4YSF3_9PROT|nr:ATP-binding protein [Paremcibacter congregatus]PHZ85255.1 GTPase [Paremcibacter congregatus]QDE27813.1 GTPase [Paremcibacter congregatus]|tara:strand:+ start:460 stop:1566 length:1107 start_codon:yes stop_codon:yes gene_type:complete